MTKLNLCLQFVTGFNADVDDAVCGKVFLEEELPTEVLQQDAALLGFCLQTALGVLEGRGRSLLVARGRLQHGARYQTVHGARQRGLTAVHFSGVQVHGPPGQAATGCKSHEPSNHTRKVRRGLKKPETTETETQKQPES